MHTVNDRIRALDVKLGQQAALRAFGKVPVRVAPVGPRKPPRGGTTVPAPAGKGA